MRLYVFDADGTLRRPTNGDVCPHAEGEWELCDGVERLRALPLVGVASNQDHVGYGFVSYETARGLLHQMIARACGRTLPDEAVQLCPHRVEDGCACRKPKTAMLERILAFYDEREALFVGNAECDRQAAQAAGIAFSWAWQFFNRTPPSCSRRG